MKRDAKRFNVPTGRGGFLTALEVCKSAAGFYIGRMHWDPDGFEEPGSRESDYYPSKQLAQHDLDASSFAVRDCVENNHAYATGALPKIRRPKR